MTAILLKTHFNACPPLLMNTFRHLWIYACNGVGDTLLDLIYVLCLYLIHNVL